MLVGLAPTGSQLSIPPSAMVLEEKQLTSTMYGTCQPHYDVPRILAVFKPNLMGARADVRGVEVHPLTWPIFHGGWLAR